MVQELQNYKVEAFDIFFLHSPFFPYFYGYVHFIFVKGHWKGEDVSSLLHQALLEEF